MQCALLREQVLAAFVHVPNSSIPVCLRMSRGILASYSEVTTCVQQLVKDGLLINKPREGRLPPLYQPTDTAQELSQQEEYVQPRPLSAYEYKTLRQAKNMEMIFAQNQDKVIAFMKQRHPMYVSALMVQDVLRNSVECDNLSYTYAVLAQLACNGEITSLCKQMLWKLN